MIKFRPTYGVSRQPSPVKLVLLVALIFVTRLTEGFSVQQHKSYPLTHSELGVVADRAGAIVERTEIEDIFFIRNCLPADIGQASDILTEVFFKDNTNLFTYQWERLTTYLSLEGSYPKPGERHAMFVACHANTGRVMGMAEIDDKPSKDKNATPRPYMFNVAVDPKWRRRGIAKALVVSCEEAAKLWDKPKVYLKVRDTSEPAVAMYESMGYVTRSSRVEKLNNKYQSLLVMSKTLSET